MRELLNKNATVDYLQRIKKGASLNLLLNAIQAFGLGFASYYFHTKGLAFYKIMLIWAIDPLASLPVVLLAHKWNTRTRMMLGILGYVGMSLSLLFYSQYSWLLFAIFSGLVLGLFWVSFNYVFFLSSAYSQHAKDSSMYFIFPALASTIMPPLGALVIGNFGFKVLFLSTALAFAVPLWYARGEYFNHTQAITFREADKAYSGIRLISFFDGALHFFQWHFLTIYILLFLKTEYEVGGVLSYLALLSLLVSFSLSYASDRYNKRAVFLYPLLIGMAILIATMPSIHTLAVLVPVIGAYAIFDNLRLPIRFAVHIDLGTKDIGFWRASEFYGNIGRTIVFGVSALLLYLGNYWLPFMIFALMTFTFPFIIRQRLNSLHKLNPSPS